MLIHGLVLAYTNDFNSFLFPLGHCKPATLPFFLSLEKNPASYCLGLLPLLFLDFCITFWSQLKCHVLTILARTVTLLLHQLLPLCSITLFYFLLKFYLEFFFNWVRGGERCICMFTVCPPSPAECRQGLDCLVPYSRARVNNQTMCFPYLETHWMLQRLSDYITDTFYIFL